MLFQNAEGVLPLLLLMMLVTPASTCDTFNNNSAGAAAETVLQTVPQHLRTLTIVSGIADSIFLTIIIILLRILYSLQASSRASTTVICHAEDTAVIV